MKALKVPPEKSAENQTVFALMQADHREIRAEAKKILKLIDAEGLDEAKSAFIRFETLLRAHCEAEERSLYSVLLGRGSESHGTAGKRAADQVREGAEEHHVIQVVLGELLRLPSSDPKWKAKFKVLEGCLQHHLDAEETEIREWRKLIAPSEYPALRQRYLQFKASILRESDLGGGMLGSLAMLVDRGILMAHH